MSNKSFILPCSGMGINVDRCPAVVRALEAVEVVPSVDAQQLNVKIAALVNKLLSQECTAMSYSNVEVAEMLRQLTVV